MIKIQESMPSFLSKAINNITRGRYGNNSNKNSILGVLDDAGVDLNNPSYEDITNTKKGDPRLRGIGGALFYVIGNNVVSYAGSVWRSSSSKLSDTLYSSDFYRLPISQKTAMADRVYFIPYVADPNLKSKRDQRKNSNSRDSFDRYTNMTKPNGLYIDKSGYIVDSDKYKRILADMRISNLGKFIDDASSIYSKLATLTSKVINIDPDSSDNGYDIKIRFTDLMKDLPYYFSNLDRYNREYIKACDKYGKDGVQEYDGFFAYKKNLVSTIMKLRDTTIKANQIVKDIENML